MTDLTRQMWLDVAAASPPVVVRGEDPLDLRDSIRRKLADY